jgi:PBP1b-binding outer membrane lipoprotein LpoB
MRKYIAILLLFALIFTGCTTPDIAQPTEPTSPTEPSAPTDPSVPTDPTEPPKPTEPPVPGGDLTEQQLFDALFDINSNRISVQTN